MELERLAPAKVNLFLHVGPLGDDGYHPICSLVTFADIGDVVRLRHAHEPGFTLVGPFAEALASETDNLVLRARDLALGRFAGNPPPLPSDPDDPQRPIEEPPRPMPVPPVEPPPVPIEHSQA